VLDKPVPKVFFPGTLLGFWIPLADFSAGISFHRFLLESLILAQDERWRRA
jgi:hypothetical protein